MRLWRSLEDVPPTWGPTVVMLGVFDGVHGGHQALAAATVRSARAAEASPIAVTFDPHPLVVLRPEAAPRLLTPPEYRAELLDQLGIAAVLALPFDAAMAAWTPAEFSLRVLRDALHAQVVHVGEDFRFGARAAGDVAMLRELGAEHGYEVRVLAEVGEEDVLNQSGATSPPPRESQVGQPLPRVSSTAIRRLLEAGEVRRASELLGRAYRLSGVVVRGDARGRELGYPTANLRLRADAVIPADAIYAGWLTVGKETWPAAISVGTNPTFDGVERRVEAYALDRDDLELYDQVADVDFLARLRPTLKFGSVDELVTQMALDVSEARDLLQPQSPAESPAE